MSIDKAVDSSVLDAGLTAIAGAVRSKGGTSAQLSFPSGIVTAVGNIQTGITPSGTKSITANGTYDVTQFASAAVNVDVQFPNFRRFTGTIVSTITGSGVSYDLVTDDLFHTVKDESSLLIILRTDVDPSTPYTLIGCIATNRRFYCGIDVYQNCDRFSTSRDGGFRQFSVPLNSPSDYGVGQLYVKNGKLSWHVNSVNYAIRPCNFIVDVMW